MRPPHKGLRADLTSCKANLNAYVFLLDSTIDFLKKDNLGYALKYMKSLMEQFEKMKQDVTTFCYEIQKLLEERKENT